MKWNDEICIAIFLFWTNKKIKNTEQWTYNAFSTKFSPKSSKDTPHSAPLLGCLLWVRNLIYVLLLPFICWMLYHDILHLVITAHGCICITATTSLTCSLATMAGSSHVWHLAHIWILCISSFFCNQVRNYQFCHLCNGIRVVGIIYLISKAFVLVI